jgi:hypothetical protein
MVRRNEDYSCRICYPPPSNYSERFEKFMNWCSYQLQVDTFSMKTVEAFHELVDRSNLEDPKVQEIIQVIIESYTYYEVPKYDFTTIKYLILLITQLSERFTISEEDTRDRLKKYYSESFDKEYETSPEKSNKTTPEKSPKQEAVREDSPTTFEVLENELGKYHQEIYNMISKDDNEFFK